MKFNERTLTALKPQDKDLIYWDDSFKGNRNGRFGIRVYPTGAKRYLYDYVSGNGQRHRTVIGSFDMVSLADARKAAHELSQDVYKGKDPAQILLNKRQSITFQELNDEFIEQHCLKKLRTKTTKNYQQIINLDLLPRWKDRKIASIEDSDIKAILNEIIKRGSEIQAERTREVISSLFSYAKKKGKIDSNPCSKVEEVAKTKARTRKLNQDEVLKYWEVCNQLQSRQHGLFFKLLLLTGQRKSEVAGAQWDHFETTVNGQRLWHFPVTKSGIPQTIPTSSLIDSTLNELKLLNERMKKQSRQSDKSRYDKFLFPSKVKKGAGHVTDVKKPFKLVSEMVSKEPFVPHDIRRTTANLLRQLGVSRDTVSKILNHKPSDVTGIHYDHYDEIPEMLEAWNRMAAFLEKLPKHNLETNGLENFSQSVESTDRYPLTSSPQHENPQRF